MPILGTDVEIYGASSGSIIVNVAALLSQNDDSTTASDITNRVNAAAGGNSLDGLGVQYVTYAEGNFMFFVIFLCKKSMNINWFTCTSTTSNLKSKLHHTNFHRSLLYCKEHNTCCYYLLKKS